MYSSRNSEIDAFIELGKSKGQLYTSSSKIFTPQEQAKRYAKENAEREFQEYLDEVNRQIESGDLEENTKEWNDMMSTLQATKQRVYEARKEYQDFQNMLLDLDFTNLESQLKRIQNTIDRLKTRTGYSCFSNSRSLRIYYQIRTINFC